MPSAWKDVAAERTSVADPGSFYVERAVRRVRCLPSQLIAFMATMNLTPLSGPLPLRRDPSNIEELPAALVEALASLPSDAVKFSLSLPGSCQADDEYVIVPGREYSQGISCVAADESGVGDGVCERQVTV